MWGILWFTYDKPQKTEGIFTQSIFLSITSPNNPCGAESKFSLERLGAQFQGDNVDFHARGFWNIPCDTFSLLYLQLRVLKSIEIQSNGQELEAGLDLSSALPVISDVNLDQLFNNLYL